MYNDIPTVQRSQEILDTALHRALKIEKPDKEAPYRIRKTAAAQLTSLKDSIVGLLEKYSAKFPNLEKVSTYERELIDIVVGVSDLKRALGRIEGATSVLTRIFDSNIGTVSRSLNIPQIKKSKTAAIGRASSVVNELDGALRFLGHARDVLRAIPELTPGDPTIVIAGYPNVGKSSVLAKLSRARPEIAPYAFTTKSVNIGHFHWPETGPEYRRKRYQLVDTPGLLEKPAKDRNAIERQAVLALQYLADVVVFVLDPSEACGFPLDMQLKLLTHVKGEFPGAPFLVVENKSDLARGASEHLKVSCENGEGLSELKAKMIAAVPEDKYQDLFADEAART